ncbi:alpha/beta fold hydrolase [Baekduia soli]|uniref:Alpha/beta fold hydrolase n=1 Tax=Baekduia soli TaxID=496014 RepID=A0A5B8U7Q3_9ACTN|nr:alpha/beta hydrolase [Baekduia soli]QEC48712.1 alpha/beta fold hydrolase [Baekduia soli]
MPVDLPPAVELNVLDIGSGPVVVLLHGWAMSLEAFDRQLAAFAGDHRVVAVDLRGHGASPKPWGTVHYADHAADVIAVLERLDLRDVALVGWSMGGAIGAYLAARTDRVAKVALVGSPPRFRRAPDAPWGAPPGGGEAFLENIRTRREWTMRRAVEDTLAVQLGEAVHQWLFGLTMRCPTHAAAGTFEGVLEADVREDLVGLARPVLVAHGVHDPFVSIEAARWAGGAVPGARLVEFAQSAHAPFLEEPERFNAELRAFVGGS